MADERGVWHLTAWIHGDGDPQLLCRIEATASAGDAPARTVHVKGVDAACTELVRFLEDFIERATAPAES